MKARNILDINVMLPTEDGVPAIVRSCTKPHMLYTVFNPGSKWACCTCSQAKRGYICKHKLKVLCMLKPNFEESSIARLCGSLKGTMHRGVDKIFAEKPNCTLPTLHAVENFSTEGREPQFDDPMETDNMEEQVCNIMRQMVQDAQGNDVLMRHLLAGILRVKGSQSRLTVDIESGILHPSQSIPQFDIADDHSGYSLKRRRDFLERE